MLGLFPTPHASGPATTKNTEPQKKIILFPNEFQYNAEAIYPVPAVPFSNNIDYHTEVEKSLTHLTIAVSPSPTETFTVLVDDLLINWPIRFNKLEDGKHCHGCDMKYWQNQLNIAVWCASAGCGVS
jgi:hypothetical protein